jgi:hypothetical protein
VKLAFFQNNPNILKHVDGSPCTFDLSFCDTCFENDLTGHDCGYVESEYVESEISNETSETASEADTEDTVLGDDTDTDTDTENNTTHHINEYIKNNDFLRSD